MCVGVCEHIATNGCASHAAEMKKKNGGKLK